MMNYNKIAKNYDIYSATTEWALGYKNVLKSLQPLANKIIIDFGGGSGKFSKILIRCGAKVIGVDTSEEMVKLAKKSNLDYHLIKGPKLRFLKNSSVDGVVFNFVLCAISSKNKILKIFRETNRIMKKDSKLVILNSNWDKSNGREFVSFKLNHKPYLKSGDEIFVTLKARTPIKTKDYYWSKKDYTSILEKAKFKIQSISEPKAKNSEDEWIDEKKYPPFLIIVAKK